FHGVENAAVGERSDVMNRDDAGVFESGEHTRLADEPIGEIAVGGRAIKNFQCYAALQLLVLGGVDDPHAAASDAIEQPVPRAGKIGQLRAAAQSCDSAVGKKFHFASQPKAARASR